MVTISKDPRHPSESMPPTGIADKPMSDACFNDWKRFCFVLREIASGDNGRPLSGLAAQKRAQAALTECGYTWPGCVQVPEPIAVPFAGQKSLSTQARVDLEQFPAGNQLKSGGKAQSPPGRRRIDPYSSEHRVGPSVNSRST
jgi:hypothetical protein